MATMTMHNRSRTRKSRPAAPPTAPPTRAKLILVSADVKEQKVYRALAFCTKLLSHNNINNCYDSLVPRRSRPGYEAIHC